METLAVWIYCGVIVFLIGTIIYDGYRRASSTSQPSTIVVVEEDYGQQIFPSSPILSPPVSDSIYDDGIPILLDTCSSPDISTSTTNSIE